MMKIPLAYGWKMSVNTGVTLILKFNNSRSLTPTPHPQQNPWIKGAESCGSASLLLRL